MRITLGAPVMSGNDKIGNVHSVAYNPETLQLTHIIIKRGGLFSSDASIPFRAIQDAHANDNGGTVQVMGDNGVVGMRDFNRDHNSGNDADTGVGAIASPQAPTTAFGIGVPAAMQIPGTPQPTGTTQSVNTAGLNAEPTDYAATRSAFTDGAPSNDLDSAPDSFAGSGGNAADESHIPDVEDATTSGSDDVPLGVFYLMQGAKVRDIGHDPIGTLEAVNFNDASAPMVDSLIIKSSNDTLVVPGAWLGSITEDDKNISLKRSREELQEGGQGQFAQAPETARKTGIVASDHDLDNGGERTSSDTGRMQDMGYTDVPGSNSSVPYSQEDSVEPGDTTRNAGEIAGGLGRTPGSYSETDTRSYTPVTAEQPLTADSNAPAFGQTRQSALNDADRQIESTGTTLRNDMSNAGATFAQDTQEVADVVTGTRQTNSEGREVFDADDVLDNRRSQTDTNT